MGRVCVVGGEANVAGKLKKMDKDYSLHTCTLESNNRAHGG